MKLSFLQKEKLITDQLKSMYEHHIAKSLVQLRSSLFDNYGNIISENLLTFIYSKLDDEKEVLSKIPKNLLTINRLIESEADMEKIVQEISKDPSLAEIIKTSVPKHMLWKSDQDLSAAVTLGLDHLKPIIKVYALLQNFPEPNIFKLKKSVYLNISMKSATTAVELALLLFKEKSKKNILNIEEYLELGDLAEYTIYNDIYFISLLRYLAVSLVHRVVQHRVIDVYEKEINAFKNDIKTKKIPGLIKQNLSVSFDEMLLGIKKAVITEVKRLDITEIANKFLTGVSRFSINNIYQLNQNLLKRNLTNYQQRKLFEYLLNYILIKRIEENILEKVNIYKTDVRAKYLSIEEILVDSMRRNILKL